MAASGYTPISLYHSTTTGNTPSSSDLVDGELAINIADGLLFYKDAGGTVQPLGTNVSIGVTPPASPIAGALWWDDVAGKLKIYYTDANGSQWVDSITGSVGATGASGFSGYSGLGLSGYSGISGYSGAVGATGTSGYSGYSGSGAAYDVQTFTSSGTWTKPAGVNNVRVIAIGGGAGGGSGRKGANSSTRFGGSGGTQGAYINQVLFASSLTSTVSVTIGNGGTGGASQTTNSTNGNNGNAGGNTTFGSYLTSYGGMAGVGGGNTSAYSGTVAEEKTGFELSSITRNSSGINGTINILGATNQSYGSSSTNISLGGGYGIYGAGGGGGGGGITAGNALATTVGYGGYGAVAYNGGFAGGTATTTDGSTGGNGTAATANQPYGGGGGGGGQASTSGNAGAGGNGALYGGGGGGGGASVDSVGNSGAGGNGADGICVVVSW